MTPSRRTRRAAAALLPLALSGCAGIQSALEPAGGEAARIYVLFWVLTVFCAVVFVGVFAVATLALFGKGRWRERLAGEKVVIGAGLIFPAVSLSALLAYGVFVMSLGAPAVAGGGLSLSTPSQPAGDAAASEGLQIEVVGERWWWRVTYVTPDGRRIGSANELRLPVGEPVAVRLASADVIHSFWVPRLAGKLDMIPGRVNTLTLNVAEPGVSRGQCAEYCGGAHALMSFFVIAMEPEEFSSWLEREAGPANPPETEAQIQGQALFQATGCGGCHAVRGTPAEGSIGPDLTHVGSRHSLAAATLPNDAEAFARWIRDNQHIKPENLMPPYAIFTDAELAQLAAYLEGLE